MKMIELGHLFSDFADAAGAVFNLDLVVSVDTAMAHLTGALGKPCWVMLPDYKTDWRWLENREDSPWYPGLMRLYRKREGVAWSAVIERICRDVTAILAGRQAARFEC
jgi:ADP-heptose:LPS heptosyltransferase